MHAFLVTGGTKKIRRSHIHQLLKTHGVSPFDQITLMREDGAVGVRDVRDFTKKLSLAPFGGKILAGIIEDAHALTPEAQNALLKTLEEPNSKTKLFLETANADLLLPTIASRCQVISLGASQQYSQDDLLSCSRTLEQMGNAKVGEQIKLIDAIATDREAAKAWVEKAITAAHFHLEGGTDSPPTAKLLRHLLEGQKQLAANVTPKLVLDAIFFNS